MIAACVLAITSSSAAAFADTYHHIDQLALTIERQSKELLRESRHYRHTPQYGHLLNDARHLASFAHHLHELAHHHGSLSHLASDVAQIDAKFHHVESLFERIEHDAAYGHGHVHGHTRHVKQLLCSMEDNIHHLQDDIRYLRAHRHPVVVRPAITYSPRPSIGWGLYNRPTHRGPTHRGTTHRGTTHRGPTHRGTGHGGWGHGGWGHGTQSHRSRSPGISIGGGSTRLTIRF